MYDHNTWNFIYNIRYILGNILGNIFVKHNLGSIGLFWLEKVIIDKDFVYESFSDEERNDMYFQSYLIFCVGGSFIVLAFLVSFWKYRKGKRWK